MIVNHSYTTPLSLSLHSPTDFPQAIGPLDDITGSGILGQKPLKLSVAVLTQKHCQIFCECT